MSEIFMKLVKSDETEFLILNKTHAFRLLTIIAHRVRRQDGHPDGLRPGECHLGDWKSMGMSQQNYRTAKKILEARQHIKILETNRNRKKSTTGVTTAGTKVKLISSTVYDLNINIDNDRHNDCLTTDQRLTNDELRKNKKDKSVKKTTTPTPSGVVVVVDNSKENAEAAHSLKSWLDKQALLSRKRKIGSYYETVVWGDDWILPLIVYEKLIKKYGSAYVEEQVRYMYRTQLEFDKGKGKEVRTPEAYLQKACKENYASAKTKEDL